MIVASEVPHSVSHPSTAQVQCSLRMGTGASTNMARLLTGKTFLGYSSPQTCSLEILNLSKVIQGTDEHVTGCQ